MYLPVLSRLRALEWPVLIFSLLLVVLESVVLSVTTLLPGPVIRLFDRVVKKLFRRFSPLQELNQTDSEIGRAIATSPGFVELCALFGYDAEEHIVKTEDGYLLGIHRIGGPRGSNWRSEKSMKKKRPVVYLHHGLLMNSEVWIVNVDPQKCLPFVLADLGYDVWLGNNRGNKYSKKHVSRHPLEKDFWNFSMDDFALYDIPDTIEYILECANKKSLSYIGFSQGSAQAFAALSIHPKLNTKVKLFIALAPAMAPPGLANQVVDSLMKATPQLIYLVFGKKAILKSTTFWQSIMYPPVFVRVIDISLRFLFGWTGDNISFAQKTAAYAHLYSYTSVKSVVHWFQIIRNGRFHMFDDDVQSIFIEDKNFYKVAPFPTHNIISPIVLVYGKSDSLVDIDVMLKELPAGTAHVGIPHHEHLDIIWGDRVDALVFPYVLSALERVDGVAKERLKNE